MKTLFYLLRNKSQ